MRINDNNDRAARAMRAVQAYKANDWRGYAAPGSSPAALGYHLNDDGVWRKDGEPDLREAPTWEELLEAVGDLLGDLHHLTDRINPHRLDLAADRDLWWDQVIDKGDFHYREELAEEGLEARGVTSWMMGEASIALRKLEGTYEPESATVAELRVADPWANRGVLRAFLECLTDRIDPQHFPVEETWLEGWVLENGDRIEEEAFRGLDGIERDALESFEELRRDQAETRRENGE